FSGLDDRPRQRGVHADRDRLGARTGPSPRVRRRRDGRGRRLVSRLVHAREGRGDRPARRRRNRVARRARRRHHRWSRPRAVGRAALVARRPRRHGVDHGRPARAPRAHATDREAIEAMSGLNGNGRDRQQDKVRVAIIGVGNCANSFLQGLTYYKDANPDDFVPGLMHVDLGGYHIRDVEVVAAFADVAPTGVTVSRGMTLDGLGKYLSQIVEKADGPTDDVVGILRDRQVDVVVNYLPVGSEDATRWYAEHIMAAGCAMVNCMPVFIAREDYWNNRFREAGVPIIGDDIKSQEGATITHRVLTSLFRERGVHLDKTMQLNVGGNSDFLNMLERERLESKKISKTNAVTSML